MSDSTGTQEHRAHLAEVVREHVWTTLIAAAFLCIYGFCALAAPEVKDLFTLSNAVFLYTLRVGGLLLALIGLWSLTGQIAALALNGAASCIIGALFVLSGGGMLIDGGAVSVNTLLILLFGALFFRAGLGLCSTCAHLARGGRVRVHDENERLMVPAQTIDAVRPPEPPIPVESPASVEHPTPSEPATPAVPTAEETPAPDASEAPEPEAPPEGFLAAMAKKPPTHDGT